MDVKAAQADYPNHPQGLCEDELDRTLNGSGHYDQGIVLAIPFCLQTILAY